MDTIASALEETYARPTYAGVCVVDGYGVRVTVERGQLAVEDGIGGSRRLRTFPRAGHGLKRVVCLNPRGYISFDAFRWCSALNIAVVVLTDGGGAVGTWPARRTDDARLRRGQGSAAGQPVGVDIARFLLRAALEGRRSEHLGELERAETLEELREVEKHAAHTFWGRWTAVPRFRGEVPAHWTKYAGRSSLVTGRNRGADRPALAMLNYLYTLLEAEATIACHMVGLDPGIGILHNDLPYKQAMAFDLMEPVRPDVETFVLELLTERVWSPRDFHELPNGICRVRAPLTHELAESTRIWAHKVGPYAEAVAHMLGAAMPRKYRASTPLSQGHRRKANAPKGKN